MAVDKHDIAKDFIMLYSMYDLFGKNSRILQMLTSDWSISDRPQVKKTAFTLAIFLPI